MTEFVGSHGSERGKSEAPPRAETPIEAPVVVPSPDLLPDKQGGLSTRQKLISVIAGAGALIGAGLFAINKDGDSIDSTPSTGDVSQGIGTVEHVPPPSIDRFKGMASDENFLTSSNSKGIGKAELSYLEDNKSNATKLLPIPFDVEGQEIKTNIYGVSFDGKTPETTGIMTIAGVNSGTEVFAPISGKIDVRDVELPNGTNPKLLTIRNEKDGKELILQIFVPNDVDLTFDPEKDSNLDAGESILKFGQTVVINEKVGQSIEMHALQKNAGEPDSTAITKGINVASEQGKALYISNGSNK